MKLADTILFSIAVVMLIIGIHQSLTVGFGFSYFFFMMSISSLLLYKMRKDKRNRAEEQDK